MSRLPKNQLTFEKSYKLTRWLEENKDGMKALTQDQIGKRAEAEMGFPVTTGNVQGSAKTLGISIGRLAGSYQNLGGKSKDTNRVLARCLCNIYTSLGEAVPQDLAEIASR